MSLVMQPKTVLVKTPGDRNFKIQFTSYGSNVDYRAFHRAFLEACQNDLVMKDVIQHSEFSFVRHDKQFNCSVQLLAGDEINNGDVIEAYVVSTHEIFQNVNTENVQNPVLMTNNLIAPSVKVEESETTTIPKEAEANKNTKTKLNNDFAVPYPCKLPVFSAAVQKALEEVTVAHLYTRFVRECATGLLTFTNHPTKRDYENFARSIVEKYNHIMDKNVCGISPYGYFKKMLSRCVRNSRYYAEKKNFMKTSNLSVESVAEVLISKEVDNSKHHIEEMTKTLLKNKVEEEHVKQLLDETAEHRRNFLLQCNNIQAAQSTYVALRKQAWILYDFDTITNTTTAMRRDRYNVILAKLTEMRGLQLNTDDDVLKLFIQVQREVSSKFLSCMTLLKVGDAIISNCSEVQAPFGALYLNQAGMLQTVTILAQKGIVVTLDEISPFNFFECLLAVYFVFDYEFPKAYRSILLFLQYILLESKVSLSTPVKIVKFLKKLDM